MQTTLAAEAKEDAKLYKQLTCWCESGKTDKTAAVEQAEADISRLESDIEARGKAAEQYALDVKAGMEDQRKLKDSLERADAQRQQAYDAYRKDLIQTRGDLELMKQAIYILREHQAVSFPQIKVGLLGLASTAGRTPADDLDKLSRWMDKHSFDQSPGKSSQVDTAVLQYEKKAGFSKPAVPGSYTESELALLARARKAVDSFLQSHDAETSGTGHMGEILGILEQMKDDFTKHLEELDTTEKAQVEEYNGMVDGLKKALAESEKITMAKEMKAAENKKAKADAAELLEATKTGLDADTAFLVNMRATCAAQDKEWASRTEMRQQEMKAVGEAMRILDSDDNKDLASKTLGNMAFVQVAMDSRGERAASVLTRAGKGLLAALARKGKFPKVIKAIDEMVVALKEQQKDEVEHKDFCNKKFHEIEISTMKKTNTQSGLQAKLDAGANELENIAEEKTQITTEITDTTVALQSANVDRVSESQEFQTVVADQRAVKAVLLEVLDKLEKVYGKSFLQEEKPGSKDHMVKFWGQSWGKGHPAAKAAEPVTATVVRAVEKNAAGDLHPLQAETTAKDSSAKAMEPEIKKIEQTRKKEYMDLLHPAEVQNTTNGTHSNTTAPLKGALVQGGQSGRQTPPGQFSTYKQHAGSGAVLSMLKSLVKEAEGMEKKAIEEENAAVQAYTSYVSEAQASLEALQKKLLSAQERKADAEVRIGEDTTALDLVTDDLADLAGEKAATHEACDFVVKNFDVRQAARTQEMEALAQAKAILSGA